MLLEDAIRKGIVKLGDYIYYKPVMKSCTLFFSQTGVEEPQTFETEPLNWQLRRDKNRIVVVAEYETNFKLTFKGKTGYDQGIKTLEFLCKELYSNSMASEVTTITEELQRELALYGKETYWIASRANFTQSGYSYDCMHYARNNHIVATPLYDQCGDSKVGCHAILPIVFLRADVQVVIPDEEKCGSKESPWQILEGISTAPSEINGSIARTELEQLIREGEEWFVKLRRILNNME